MTASNMISVIVATLASAMLLCFIMPPGWAIRVKRE